MRPIIKYQRRFGSILVAGLVAVPLLVPAGGATAAPGDRSAGALDEATLEERETVGQAARRAKALGQPVEALELRTETRSVFVHPSGSRSAKLYAGPVRVEQGGRWRPLDTTDLDTNGDTYVSSDRPRATYGGSDELKSGSSNGRNRHRSLVRFPELVSSARGVPYGLRGISKGARVTSAAMYLYNHRSSSCRPRTTEVYRVSRAWGVNSASWAKQPVVGARYGSAAHANGYSSACPAGDVGFSITALAQKWVDESVPNYGVRVQPKDEAKRDTFSRFRSANYAGRSLTPFLVVDYTPVYVE